MLDSSWPAVEKSLPANAPADARKQLERRAQRLSNLRSDRAKRLTTPKLDSCIKKLEAVESEYRECGWTEHAECLSQLRQHATRERRRLKLYKAQGDPDREELYMGLLADWIMWGGLLGDRGAPRPLRRFFSAATKWLLGNEAPAESSVSKIVGRFRKRLKLFVLPSEGVMLGSEGVMAVNDARVTIIHGKRGALKRKNSRQKKRDF